MSSDGLSTSIKFLRKKIAKAPSIFEKHFQQAGLEFITHIQERWYSGRRNDDTGLYIGTGRARASWFPKTTITNNNEVETTISTSATYLKDHEFGKGKYKGKRAKPPIKDRITKPINFEFEHIPVRTFVRKDLKQVGGRKFFVRAVRKSLKEIMKQK